MRLREGKLRAGIGYDVVLVSDFVKLGPGGFLLARQTISGVAVGRGRPFEVLEQLTGDGRVVLLVGLRVGVL